MPNEPLVVLPATIMHQDGGTLVSLTMQRGASRDTIHARLHSIARPPPAVGDAALSATLIGAMKEGRPLRLSDPVSPRLMESVPWIQGVLHLWYPELSEIPVEADTIRSPEPGGLPDQRHRAAHFFSGGVDSFYSVFEHRAGLEALVFVDGIDLEPESVRLRSEVAGKLNGAAGEFGLPLLHVETNFMSWARQFGWFGNHFIGARLAFVAHLLGGEFRELQIAPSATMRLNPFPSHPLVDPKWSSEFVEILHSPPALSRAVRLQRLAGFGFPLRYLRVCMQSKTYNCCECPKCRRTMISLHLAGALERCPAFPRPLDFDRDLAALSEADDAVNELIFLRENIELAEATGASSDVRSELEAAAEILEARLLVDDLPKCERAFWDRVRWSKVTFDARRRTFRELLARNPEWLLKETGENWDDQRDPLFELLWKRDRKWLVRRTLKSWLKRLGARLRGRA